MPCSTKASDRDDIIAIKRHHSPAAVLFVSCFVCDAERATPSNNHILLMNEACFILAEKDFACVVLSVENIIYGSATIIAQSSAPSHLDAIAKRRDLCHTYIIGFSLFLSGKALPGSKKKKSPSRSLQR
jgi:hypothetical protein